MDEGPPCPSRVVLDVLSQPEVAVVDVADTAPEPTWALVWHYCCGAVRVALQLWCPQADGPKGLMRARSRHSRLRTTTHLQTSPSHVENWSWLHGVVHERG